MKQITIDLAGPFEEIVANLRFIPPINHLKGSKDTAAFELSPEVQDVVRSIYEAARGRQFATQIGLIPAGPPPVAPFLKDIPFQVESHADFLLQALARLYSGNCTRTENPSRKIERKPKTSRVEFQTSASSRRQRKGLSHVLR